MQLNQIELPLRPTDPDTSHNHLSAEHLTKVQQDILTYLRMHPNGATDLELTSFFDDQTSTYRSRRAELVKCGKVKDSDQRRAQPGRKRIVWILA